jgi:hypothetical protein
MNAERQWHRYQRYTAWCALLGRPAASFADWSKASARIGQDDDPVYAVGAAGYWLEQRRPDLISLST